MVGGVPRLPSLLIDSVPPLMAVLPVKVLLPLSVCVPAPVLVRATVPLPSWMTPEKLPLPPPAPIVNVAAPATPELTVPLPFRPLSVGLRPCRSSVEVVSVTLVVLAMARRHW